MSIPMNSICLECYLGKRLKLAREKGTPEQATEIARFLANQFGQSPENMDSALLAGLCDHEIYRILGMEGDLFREEKEMSNRFVMERLEDIRSRVEKAEDPLYAALQFAVLGNYLDFAALAGKVSFQKLDQMLDEAYQIDLDRETYEQFRRDLEQGKEFLYITDNAGEICFDRITAEVIAQKMPHLNIRFLVRGKPVANDATLEDAQVAGITFPVIENGTAIGGTTLHLINQESREAIEQADVILAKGMGNTESMFGCGFNVYYAFLVKCVRFEDFFGAPSMKPRFVRDRK